MRGIRLGAVLGAAALLVAAMPADARNSDYAGTIHVSGSVYITWHGDPARGCADAGLCGYAGSLTIRPGESQYDFRVNGRGRPVEGHGTLDLFDPPPQVRVRRVEAGGDEGGCADASPIETADVLVSRAGGRRVRFALATEGLSTGRCAGPPVNDLLARLPRPTRSVSRLIRGGQSLDFSRTFAYSRGRFTGTVRSTLRLTFGKPSLDLYSLPEFPPPRHPPRRPLVRVVHVHAVYRVTRFAGALGAQFGGLTEPPCADFDACGVTGSDRWDVTGQRGTFSFEGDALARRSDHGLQGGLAAIRRRGAFVFGDSGLGLARGTTAADLTRPGGAECRDTSRASSPGADAFNSGKRLVFELGGEDAIPALTDVLRAGCPGPRDADVLGFDPAARGSIPLAALGRPSLGVRLRGSGQFSASGYAGSRSGDFMLNLERVSIRAVYGRARGI